MDRDIDEQFEAALDKLIAQYRDRGLDREFAIVVLQEGLKSLWREGERHWQVSCGVSVCSPIGMPSVSRMPM